MKTIIFDPRAIKITRIMILLFSLQINFLTAAKPYNIGNEITCSICVTCSISSTETLNDELSNDILFLSPTVPDEATFSDEADFTEADLIPSAPSEASFDDDSELINASLLHYLAPSTPSEADFND
jgi:hypothetical protein